ncbi:MAG: hypothetical protein IJR79_01670 [Clostridia bacterium]|nr:hypothetical protein [Clostridia bacterium]MBQ7751660.1 hypothetical protein [Clostridia bacterium]
MKTVFLSIKALICGYICDFSHKMCQKNVEFMLKKGKSLSNMPTVYLAKFYEKRLLKWHKLEKKLIYLLFEA